MDVSQIEKQIKDIEDEIFNTQKNKATEHHIGKLKAKIARLKQEAGKRKSSASKGKGFSLKKAGDATVGLVGFPSVGKSTLLNQLTRASSKIGDYDFTTLETVPGIMKYNGADIQIFDLPGLISGASKGRGRGREILSAIRNVDLLILMVDALQTDQLEVIEKELYEAGIRINERPPDVVVTKKSQGGIIINSTITQTHLSLLHITSIASEFVINADITIRENITEDRLIDAFSDNRVYVSALIVLNKIDLVSSKVLAQLNERSISKDMVVIPIAAKDGKGIDNLKHAIFAHLELLRVYMKPVGKQADFQEPLILRKGQTIEDACKKLHRDFVRKFRYATVTGPSAKHPSQKVGLDHQLCDQDVLTVVIQK